MNVPKHSQNKLQILTANDLKTGDVIYFTNQGWSRSIAKGKIFGDTAEATRALNAAVQEIECVGSYLIEITIEDKIPNPLEFREKIRAQGTVIFRTNQGGKNVSL